MRADSADEVVLVVAFLYGEIVEVREMAVRNAETFIAGYNLALKHWIKLDDGRAYLWPDGSGEFPIENWPDGTSEEEIESELRSMIKD